MFDERDAGRRAEPDHRAAEADRIGEHAPVVAALLQRQRGERDVVEHRGDEAEAEAVCQDAAGSFSTGIIEAQVTSDSRKMVPLNASGSSSQSGLRSGAVTRMRHPHGDADEREAVEQIRDTARLTTTLAEIAATRMSDDDADARPVDLTCRGGVLHDRRVALLLKRGRDTEDDERDDRRDVGVEDGQRADAVDPHHRGRGVADDAARSRRRSRPRRSPRGSRCAPCRGTPSCAIAPPISAAAMLSRKDDSTKTITSSTKAPFQSSGRKRGRTSGTSLFSKCRDEQREAHQQQEQIGEDHPLVPQVQRQGRRGRGRT